MSCEICGDTVVRPEPAKQCRHTVRLCEACKAACPGALLLCVRCEDGDKGERRRA